METLSSAQNPKIKGLLALQEKSKLRRSSGLFVLEGKRELQHCIEAGFEIDSIFVCPQIAGDDLAIPDGVRCFSISPEIYARMACREGTEGVIAEVRCRNHSLSELEKALQDRPDPLIMVVESVEKPGNLGAIFRSADASGADAVLVCDPLTDLYNPNLIRSSIGSIFSVPAAVCSSDEAIAWLKSRKIQILTAQLQDSSLYYDCDMTAGTAIVMGTESTGLSEVWRQAADRHIRIPMLGRLDSLNVSVSAAILLYEAVRQRMSDK